MKTFLVGSILLVLLAAGSLWAAPQYPFRYECECVDVAWNCDTGFDRLDLIVSGSKSVKVRLRDQGKTLGVLEALRDVVKPSKARNDFRRFYHNNTDFTKIYPHLLLEMNLLRGDRTGVVLIPEFAKNKQITTREFACELARRK